MARLLRQAEVTYAALIHIALGMRPEEVEEVWAIDRQSPYEALKTSYESSEYARICLSPLGEPMCAWGICRFARLPDWWVPWMLGTSEIDRYLVSFMKTCRALLPEMARRFPQMRNIVDARYEKSLEWLRRLGFEVRPAMDFNGTMVNEVIFKWAAP